MVQYHDHIGSSYRLEFEIPNHYTVDEYLRVLLGEGVMKNVIRVFVSVSLPFV